MTGKQVESWEVAYFNGAAILDEIPVANRDQTDQVAFRDRSGGGFSTHDKFTRVRWKIIFTLSNVLFA